MGWWKCSNASSTRGSVDGEADSPERQALGRLESAVGRILGELSRTRDQLARERARVRAAEGALEAFRDGDEDPVELRERVLALERENKDLKERVMKSRQVVERLLARIRFLEEQG